MHKGAVAHRVAVDGAAVGLQVSQRPGVGRGLEVVDDALPVGGREPGIDVSAGLGFGDAVRQVVGQGVGVVFQPHVHVGVGAGLVHQQLRAGDGHQRCNRCQPVLAAAAEHALHHVHGHTVLEAQVHHVAQGVGRTGLHVARLHQSEYLGRVHGVPADGPGPHLVQPLHAVGHLQHHAKVAARAAAQGPVEVRVLLRAGSDDGAVGQRHTEGVHQIALDAERTRGVAVAAALHKPPHAHTATGARGHVPARVVHGAVEVVEVGAGQHVHAFARRVQHHALQVAQVHHHAAVDRVAGRAVATTTHGHPHAVGAGHGQALQHIVFAGAKDDDLRVRLEGRVRLLPRGVVVGAGGQHDAPDDPRLQCGHRLPGEYGCAGLRRAQCRLFCRQR